MSGSLSGQVVVVTGGAGRLGRAFCAGIVREGAIVVVADTATKAAEQVAADLCKQYGAQAATVASFDITRVDQINEAIEQLHERFGRIDSIVNNAYPRNERYGAKFEDVTYSDFVENVSLHLGGYFLAAQQFCAYFVRQGYGNVVNLGSIYGVVAPRFEIYTNTSLTMPVEYSAIKAGVVHLTRYLAQYFKQKGIRVNALSPGGVQAEQPPGFVQQYGVYSAGNRMLDSTDIVGALIFLLAPASAHITGQNIVVDDGWTL